MVRLLKHTPPPSLKEAEVCHLLDAVIGHVAPSIGWYFAPGRPMVRAWEEGSEISMNQG